MVWVIDQVLAVRAPAVVVLKGCRRARSLCALTWSLVIRSSGRRPRGQPAAAFIH